MTTVTPTHEVATRSVDPDAICSIFIEAVPDMDEAKQRLGIALYRSLAKGKPVSFKQLASDIDRTEDDIHRALFEWPGVFFNDDNDVIGFWGIAVKPKGHRMEINGVTSYAWCAWDSLFIPELVGATAQVTSKCEQTGEEITLTVSPDSVKAESHPDIVVSFVTPDVEELRTNATTSFCHFVYFFKDRLAGEAWTKKHDGTFLLSLNEAFAVGKKLNAARYNQILN